MSSNPWLFNGYPRIMARIGEEAPVELWRSPPGRGGKIFPQDIAAVTRELDVKVWTWWIEHTTAPWYLISDRPKLRHTVDDQPRDRHGRLRLSTSERDQLELDQGLQREASIAP